MLNEDGGGRPGGVCSDFGIQVWDPGGERVGDGVEGGMLIKEKKGYQVFVY